MQSKAHEITVRKVLDQEIKLYPGSVMTGISFETTSLKSIVRATVGGINPPTIDQVKTIETKLPLAPGKTANELRIRFVKTMILNREGLLYDDVGFGSGSNNSTEV